MAIKRTLYQKLVHWKGSRKRKPLIMNGVRQCGKTWLLKYFGEKEFEDVVYLNFEKDENLAAFFQQTYEPAQILRNLSAYTSHKIIPNKTLLVFDEIQLCPRALNSLKYFCEETPEYAIASAGSLLGIALAAKEGFPVGKVDFLELTPCTFQEYLLTVEPEIYDILQQHTLSPFPPAFVHKLTTCLREYLTFGGMPAVLSEFIDSKEIESTERELSAVLTAYESDFSKHIPAKDIPKLHLLWKSIPVQFAKENRRFFYGEVRSGARAKDLEDALQWLINTSMVIQIKNVESPSIPLKAYEDRKTFKLYPADVGILRSLAGLPPGILLNQSDLFAPFKGKLVENFVLQQLHAMNYSPICYWTNPTGQAEVDFLIQENDEVIPIETKSGLNTKAQSLRFYRDKYHPLLAVRTSMQNLKLDNNLLNIPLYLISELPHLLNLAKKQIVADE